MSPWIEAWKTPQFWLLWVILCFNVTAGIGILEQASPMIQEMFLVRSDSGIGSGNTPRPAAAKATGPLRPPAALSGC
jgi:GTP cyclohydrolase III